MAGFLNAQTGLGAVAGGALGAGAGYLLTGRKRPALIGALLGIAGGAVAGNQLAPGHEAPGEVAGHLAAAERQLDGAKPTFGEKAVGAFRDEVGTLQDRHPRVAGALGGAATAGAVYGVWRAGSKLLPVAKNNPVLATLAGLTILAGGYAGPSLVRSPRDMEADRLQLKQEQDWQQRNGVAPVP